MSFGNSASCVLNIVLFVIYSNTISFGFMLVYFYWSRSSSKSFYQLIFGSHTIIVSRRKFLTKWEKVVDRGKF